MYNFLCFLSIFITPLLYAGKKAYSSQFRLKYYLILSGKKPLMTKIVKKPCHLAYLFEKNWISWRFGNKKRKKLFGFYGRFFIISNASIAPTMKIETIMPATAGRKYMSAAVRGVGVAGGGVAVSSTAVR